MINTKSKSLKPRKLFIFQHFTFYEQLKFHTQLSWAWKKFYYLGASGAEAHICITPSFKYALVALQWDQLRSVWSEIFLQASR